MAHEPTEDRLFKRLRAVAVVVILALVAFLVIIDAVGRLIIDPNFRVSDVALSALLGALMLALGIEVASRLPKIGSGK